MPLVGLSGKSLFLGKFNSFVCMHKCAHECVYVFNVEFVCEWCMNLCVYLGV